MASDRNNTEPIEEPENGVLAESGDIDASSLGFLDGNTAQISVIMPGGSEEEDDYDDDDTDDVHLLFDALLNPEIMPVSASDAADVIIETTVSIDEAAEANTAILQDPPSDEPVDESAFAEATSKLKSLLSKRNRDAEDDVEAETDESEADVDAGSEAAELAEREAAELAEREAAELAEIEAAELAEREAAQLAEIEAAELAEREAAEHAEREAAELAEREAAELAELEAAELAELEAAEVAEREAFELAEREAAELAEREAAELAEREAAELAEIEAAELAEREAAELAEREAAELAEREAAELAEREAAELAEREAAELAEREAAELAEIEAAELAEREAAELAEREAAELAEIEAAELAELEAAELAEREAAELAELEAAELATATAVETQTETEGLEDIAVDDASELVTDDETPTEKDPNVTSESQVPTKRDSHDLERVNTNQDIPMTSKRLEDLSSSSRETSDLLTADRLLEPSRLSKPEPEGAWRHMIYSVTGKRINLGDSKQARARKAMTAEIAAPLAGGSRFVPVLSRKGGVGKTTVTALLGMALADARDDRVIAVDANPDRGTLAERISRPTTKTVRDLVRVRDGIRGYNDISDIVARDETRLDVLASDTDPRVSEAFSDEDYRHVADVAARYYSLVLTDTGTGIVHSVMGATLDLADQLVIVAGLSVDEARLASETLTWLEANGYGEKARNAIVVLNQGSPGAPLVRLAEVEAHFRTRVRDVVTIPYDTMIATGSAISFRDLQPETRLAARTLASKVIHALRQPAS